MSEDEMEIQAQDLINQVEQENKLKEEKIASQKTSSSISKAPTNELIKEEEANKLIKKNTIKNKRIESSKSECSSELESLDSLQEKIDEEKQIELTNKIVNNKNPRRSSVISTESTLENLMITQDINLKLCTLISCVCCTGTTTLSIIGSLLFERLLTFNYGNSKDSQESKESIEEITMNHTMIYILLGIIGIFNIGIVSMVSLNSDHMLTNLIYSELNWFFALTQFAFASLFLITLIFETDLWTINVCLSISMLTILILAFYYTEIKQKKNMSKGTLIFIYAYISILFAFISYVTLYNISCILLENIDNEEKSENTDFIMFVKIGINAGQTILSFVVLTYLKDIFFALTSGYIECAVFINENFNLDKKENIALLVMVLAILLGVILTIYRYKKRTFGYEEVILGVSKNMK